MHGSQNKYIKDMSLQKVGRHAQNMITILDKRGKGDLYDYSTNIKMIFTLKMNKTFIRSPKLTRESGYVSPYGCANHLVLG
jgi:hypothetical protein